MSAAITTKVCLVPGCRNKLKVWRVKAGRLTCCTRCSTAWSHIDWRIREKLRKKKYNHINSKNSFHQMPPIMFKINTDDPKKINALLKSLKKKMRKQFYMSAGIPKVLNNHMKGGKE